MEGFFPDKFLDDAFWDQPIVNNNGFLQFTEIETRQNSIVEDKPPPPPPPVKQSNFLQLGQQSSQTVLNSDEGAFSQYSEKPEMGLRQENSCCVNRKDHGYEASSPAGNPNAFVEYRELARTEHGEGSSSVMNMRKRMIDYLTRTCPEERRNMADYERERGFRHMINERMRRQRQRQCCLALHSILPFGTKNDVNSVVQMAAKEIQKLEACREELKKKNAVLEEKFKGEEGNRVELKMAYSSSPIDSMLETLQLLTELGMNTRSITSYFSHQQLSASLEIHANKEEAEAERENQWKLPSHDPEIFKRQRL